MAIFEVCVGNYKEAVLAAKRGADRIELCDNLLEDGTTPSYGTIKMTIEKLNIPVMVIIRPRGGYFYYTDDELEIMKSDIEMCKNLGAYGVVIGAIKDNKIDYRIIKDLVNVAKPMSITFHMAFDEIEDKKSAIDYLVELGGDRILTKGGKENAIEGMKCLKELVEYSNGKILIMPGKGINKENRDMILEYTKAIEIHGSKIL